ncbi:PDDEXK nuclease domain-containing protein [Limnohabitans sp.]|uniref:PDDEXK nuclease domain-containing protein n=1 Tax=Limnohabitans sp. TaxID=1907725 RepID=UPI00286EF841|nr:PDDEXK nuclease domain-containing protein [Limnohabitans sp.]
MSELSTLHFDVKAILEQARGKERSAVNAAMVEAYWLIGQRIVQEEQQGKQKAQYGARMMQELSIALAAEFGKGFSYANLYNFRQFYRVFPDHQILYTLCRELSWSHLRLIIRADSQQAIEYYCKEAREQNWTVRQLERHIQTNDYKRLLSTQAQTSGQENQASHLEFIKDPYVLEFLQLPESGQLKESQLEQAIMDELQRFLLELGKGFSFVARQMRISTETSHFFLDLVFYNWRIQGRSATRFNEAWNTS